MPPKRKAAAKPEPSEPAPKRTTRSTPAVASTSATAAPKPAKAKAPAKKKKEEVLQIDSSSDSDVMIVEEPKSKGKKVAAPKKAPVPKPAPPPAVKKVARAPAEKKKPVEAATKAAPSPVASRAQAITSTSSTPVPDPEPEPKPKAKSPKKPVSWEQGLKDWFAEYEDADEPGKMGGEGIERLFEGMGASMEGSLPFVLAFKIGAKPGTFGSYSYSDFQATLREHKINSNAGIKTWLTAAEKALFAKNSGEYDSFYTLLFTFVKEDGQKSLAGEMAIALWTIALAPRYKLAQSFVDYATSLGAGFKGVSPDLWDQLLELCKTTDDDLSSYNEMDAWPSAIDSFVEWRKAQPVASA